MIAKRVTAERLLGGTTLVMTSLVGLWLPSVAYAKTAVHAGGGGAIEVHQSLWSMSTGAAGGAGGTGTAAASAGRNEYMVGKRAKTSAERRRYFAAGMAAARARLAQKPDDPEGLLWLAANLGSEALERGKLSALNVLSEMEKLLLRLEQVAPEYDHAAAARTLARVYHKAPAFISIGSMKKARAYWEKALARAPEFPANLVLGADFYNDDGQKERAVQMARKYLAKPLHEAEHPDAAEWREIAETIVGVKR